MKKRSILMKILSLLSVICVVTGVGCADKTGGSQDTSSTKESSAVAESSSEKESLDEIESSEEVVSSEDAESSEEDIPEEDVLTVIAPEGEAYPYVEQAKNYLMAGEGVDVDQYWMSMDNPYAPIQVKWQYNAAGASQFLVEYATKSDFSDALSVTVGATKRSVDLYNLYKATKYYVRVTALNSKGETLHSGESEFETTALGPRVIKIEGVYNVRDLGGYETSLGKTIVQGIAYRGGSLTDPPKDDHYDNNISEDGKKYMSEVMGIKAELDFRTEEESGVTLDEGSVIPGAELSYITLGGYTSPFGSGKESYRKVFSYFADENNYPMYYHCTGGADRTGTVTFLLHAFLGVSELECIQGFAFTSFSIYGKRASQSGIYWEEFQQMIAKLKAYEGETLQEKTENYLLSIGVTEDEIYNIKAIFFGEPTRTSVSAPASYMKNVDGDLVISVAGKKVPDKLYLGGIETAFTYNAGKITVTPDQLPALANGTVEGKVVFGDGAESVFTIDWKVMDVVLMDNLFTFDSDGKVSLTENKVPITSTGVVGYQKTALVRIETTTVDKTDGGFRVLIGSYGFECRGGEMRPYTLDTNGTMKEMGRDLGMTLSNKILNEGAVLYMSVEFVDDKPVLSIKVEKGSAVYEHTYTFASRITNEIASENAKMTFWIRTDAVTSLTIYNSTAWSSKN